MADIKQAARWMQEGLKVRCRFWINKELSIFLDRSTSAQIVDSYGIIQCLDLQDILSDDWEIAS